MWGQEHLTVPVVLKIMGIVFGVLLASAGEIHFSMTGFLLQLGGLIFESTRVVMIKALMSDASMNMDPLVSLYYYAPVCALINLGVAWFTEGHSFQLESIATTGPWVLFLNALVAFMLNISSVLLVRIPPKPFLYGFLPVAPTHFLADWQNVRSHATYHRRPEKHHPHCRLCFHLGNHDITAPDRRLRHNSYIIYSVQAESGGSQGMCRGGDRILDVRETRLRKQALRPTGSVRVSRPDARTWIGPLSSSNATPGTDAGQRRLARASFPFRGLRRDVAQTRSISSIRGKGMTGLILERQFRIYVLLRGMSFQGVSQQR